MTAELKEIFERLSAIEFSADQDAEKALQMDLYEYSEYCHGIRYGMYIAKQIIKEVTENGTEIND